MEKSFVEVFFEIEETQEDFVEECVEGDVEGWIPKWSLRRWPVRKTSFLSESATLSTFLLPPCQYGEYIHVVD